MDILFGLVSVLAWPENYGTINKWKAEYSVPFDSFKQIISEIESSGSDYGKALLADILDKCPGTRPLVEGRSK